MKQYVVAALIAVFGVAIAWVVIQTLVSGGGGAGSAYEIPEGRYDCFLITYTAIVTSSGFPKPNSAQGPFPTPPVPTYEESRKVMGFQFRIGVYDKDKTFARFAVKEAFRRIKEIEARVSVEREDSDVSKINREAFDHPVELSQELYFIIKRAMKVSFHSGGAFDITAGPVRWLWDHYGAHGQVPPTNKIREARALVGFRSVEIDDDKRTIRFKKKGLVIDLHDIIRGFAIDQAVHELRRQGMRKGFVRVDDSRHFMEHPHGRAFAVGIPGARARLKYTFDNDRPAVVTKGYYTGYKFVGDTVLSGIVDPRSGTCVGSVASCTIVGPDAMTCDALATALCVMGGSKATRFIGKFNPGEEHPE